MKVKENKCYQEPGMVLYKGFSGSFPFENSWYKEPGFTTVNGRAVTWLPQRVWPRCRRSLSIVLGHRVGMSVVLRDY